jgi:DNA-binding transcriptional LysR family regulator
MDLSHSAMLPNVESRLKLRQLALVVAICDTGSLRKASEAMHVTQPAATNALQELEFTLGVPLFVRSKAGMKPTSFGQLLVERSRLLLSNVRAIADEIQQLKDGDTGQVVIGTLPASAMTIVPQAIILARHEKPGITLQLMEGSTAQLLPALKRGEIDVIVGRIPPIQIGEPLHYEVLIAEPNEVVCRAGHPLASRPRLTLQDLAGSEWILPDEGSHVRTEVREAFVKAGLQPPEPVLVTSSTAVRLALLTTTDMLGVLTQRAARVNQEQGLVKILDVGLNTRIAPIVLVTRGSAVLTPATTSFIGFVRRAAAHPQHAASRAIALGIPDG